MTRARGPLTLGFLLDEEARTRTGRSAEIASHDLTTHGVIVGMTGSGKTGLGVVLLEEVLRSGIPALILDPKGDMGNLALRFPDLSPAAFEPWVDAGEAAREGLSTAELAARTAEHWQKGLEGSGLGSEEVRRFADSVEVRILTPGSSAGVPLNVLGDLSAPRLSWEEHGETLREEIEGLVSGVLVMAGLDPDPLTSREHILLANLVEQAWQEGRDLDLATLIGQIQTPPIRKLGVFDLDSFFPPKDRTAFALRLNALMASPSFAEWLHGDPLDVDALLFGPDGRPRASVVYLSHLSDAERQFVVTLLLSKVVTWMRRQPGTSELRALIYLDEVFGLAPPSGEPPSKRPILTIFKQARAHGVGMVVATQNPVDLDYKVMANAGAWMIGRLQTERDKARIVEALRSASGEVDVAAWDARIGALGKREFVLKTAGSPTPTLFTTRWAMSFLRGPLTRAELQRLRPGPGGGSAAAPVAGSGAGSVAGPAAGSVLGPTPRAAARPEAAPNGGSPGAGLASGEGLAGDELPLVPPVASGTTVRWIDPSTPWAREAGVGSSPRHLEPGLALRVRLLFDEDRAGLRHEEVWECVLFPLTDHPRPEDALAVDHDERDFRTVPPKGATYRVPEAPIERPEFFRQLQRDLLDHLFRTRSFQLFHNAALKLHSRAGESEEAFRARALTVAEERADAEVAGLRSKFERKLETAKERREQAERRVRELEVDVGARRQQEVIAGAGEILSLFLGGRGRVRSLSGASSRRSQTRRTQERLQSASEKVGDYDEAVQQLEDELGVEVEEVWARWRTAAEGIAPVEIPLEKTDIRLDDPLLFWASREG